MNDLAIEDLDKQPAVEGTLDVESFKIAAKVRTNETPVVLDADKVAAITGSGTWLSHPHHNGGRCFIGATASRRLQTM